MDLRRPTLTLVALLLVAAVTGTAVADHDGLERNDDFETAASIDGGTYADLHVVDGESDYYAVELAEGEELTVDVRFAHVDGDLDLAVYDPDRNEVDYSTSSNDGEHVSVAADEAGTHYVRVYGFSGASNSYDLELSIEDRVQEDQFEPNDDFDEATGIDDGYYPDVALVNGDSDLYAIELAEGEELTVDVIFAHADGDLDLSVYDPDRNEVDLSISTSDDEHVTITAEEAGTHYVWVYSFTRATNSYRLGIVRSGGETPTPTEAPTDGRATTHDGPADGETSDGAGAADEDDVDIEGSPGFELSTALLALLGGLAILRRR